MTDDLCPKCGMTLEFVQIDEPIAYNPMGWGKRPKFKTYCPNCGWEEGSG